MIYRNSVGVSLGDSSAGAIPIKGGEGRSLRAVLYLEAVQTVKNKFMPGELVVCQIVSVGAWANTGKQLVVALSRLCVA